MWSDAGATRACREAGRLLCELHTHRQDSDPGPGAGGALAQLDELVRLIRAMFPDEAHVFEAAFRRLSDERPEAPAEHALIHGDFYDKQVLYSRSRTVVLDWDQLAPGDPARDVGNFSAHATWRAVQHPESEAAIAGGVEAFFAAYRPTDSGFDDRLDWWEHATRVRLAAIYALRPRWRSKAVAWLDRTGRKPTLARADR